jgi:hypothetical protein
LSDNKRIRSVKMILIDEAQFCWRDVKDYLKKRSTPSTINCVKIKQKLEEK